MLQYKKDVLVNEQTAIIADSYIVLPRVVIFVHCSYVRCMNSAVATLVEINQCFQLHRIVFELLLQSVSRFGNSKMAIQRLLFLLLLVFLKCATRFDI
jgi:hypothetical protein